MTSPSIELYDRRGDPHELRNRAESPELKEVKSRLLTALHEWRTATGDPLLLPATFERLTREHESLASAPQTPTSEWKYHEYFAPGGERPHIESDALHLQRDY